MVYINRDRSDYRFDTHKWIYLAGADYLTDNDDISVFFFGGRLHRRRLPRSNHYSLVSPVKLVLYFLTMAFILWLNELHRTACRLDSDHWDTKKFYGLLSVMNSHLCVCHHEQLMCFKCVLQYYCLALTMPSRSLPLYHLSPTLKHNITHKYNKKIFWKFTSKI